MKLPSVFKYYTCDEVAECVKGINESTYSELWEMTAKSEESGTARPLGGDGSNGTVEEPVIGSSEFSNEMGNAWKHLSDKAKQNIIECAEEVKKEFDNDYFQQWSAAAIGGE